MMRPLVNCNRKRGFTLMELMVYIAIVGIVVIVAGQAFTNSTKFRVRTQNMIRATQDAENVAMLFKEDAAQMGAKSAKETGSATSGAEYGDKFGAVNNWVYMYMDPDNETDANKDSSSFLISSSSGFSDLIFRRVRYDDQGLLKAVEEVNWFVVNNTLKRSCRTIDGDADGDICPKGKTREEARAAAVDIVDHISKFEIQSPTPTTAEEVQIFPSSGDEFRLISRSDGGHYHGLFSENESGTESGAGSKITLSQFYTNYDEEKGELKSELNNMNQVIAANVQEPGTGWTWTTFCQNRGLIPLEKDNTYEISFEVPFVTFKAGDFETQPFVPGEDHMSVGFRGKLSGEIPSIKISETEKKPLIDDFLFYPPYTSDASVKRVMRFTVPANIDTVCLAFTFACYSPLAAQAKLKIKDLKIKRVAGANYKFDVDHPYNPEAHKNDKKNIKALKLNLQIARGGKNGELGETGEVEMVVPIPSNGPTD